jgi:hypothetical protein
MAGKGQQNSEKNYYQRKYKMQQIFFGTLAVLIILSMILTAVVR